MKSKIVHYLTAIENAHLIPNFWMSEEYIQKAGLVWCEQDGLMGFKMRPTEREWFFPPFNSQGMFVLNEKIYSGFVLEEPDRRGQFLDFQFIYDPQSFSDIKGSMWTVFRKNIRKYPKRHLDNIISYRQIQGECYNSQIIDLMLYWAGRIGQVQDNIVCIKYVVRGENRWGLFLGDTLVGVNIWDENFYFINFRYCIDNGSPFLQEYLRYKFYTSDVILSKRKLVNDGGALDNVGLRMFKEKLNPMSVNKVFQYH